MHEITQEAKTGRKRIHVFGSITKVTQYERAREYLASIIRGDKGNVVIIFLFMST
jgi:hypothetical protein